MENVDEFIREELKRGVCGNFGMFDGNGGDEGSDVWNGTILGRGKGYEREAGGLEE